MHNAIIIIIVIVIIIVIIVIFCCCLPLVLCVTLFPIKLFLSQQTAVTSILLHVPPVLEGREEES